MRIGELASRLEVNPKTIRFYEGIGILPQPARTSAGYRDYREEDLERVRFIKAAQSLGLSLEDIGEILSFKDKGEAPCPYVRRVIERQAEEIDRRISELEKIRSELRRLARVAKSLPDKHANGVICHILEHRAGSLTGPTDLP